MYSTEDIYEGIGMTESDIIDQWNAFTGGDGKASYLGTIRFTAMIAHMCLRKQWRTIDSAPKDGTIVDLFENEINGRQCDCKFSGGHWQLFIESIETDENGLATGDWYRWDDLFYNPPTHWMKPPALPGENQ